MFKLPARKTGTPRRPRRVLIAAGLSVLVGLGMIGASIVTAPPAQPFMGICEPSQSFTSPATTGGTPTTAEHRRLSAVVTVLVSCAGPAIETRPTAIGARVMDQGPPLR